MFKTTLKKFISGVKSGFFNRSSFSLYTAYLITICFLIFFATSNHSSLYRFYSYFLGVEYVHDETYAFIRASEARTKSEPAVVFTGGSSIRELLYSEPYVEQKMKNSLGYTLNSYDLTTSSQPIWFGNQVAKEALCGRGGVLYIGANLSKLTTEPNNFRRDSTIDPLFGSEKSLENALALKAAHIKSTMIYYARGYVRKLKESPEKFAELHPTQRYSVASGRHEYTNRVMPSVQDRKKLVVDLWDNLEKTNTWYYDEFESTLINFKEELTACKEIEIILLIPPYAGNDYIQKQHNELYQKHIEKINQIASRINISVLNLNQSDLVKDEYFFDAVHVNSSYFSKKLTEKISDFTVEVINND